MSLFKLAENDILKRRLIAQQRAHHAYSDALRDSEIAAADSAAAAVLPLLARAEAEGTGSDELARKYSSLLARRDALLKDKGIDPTNFKPNYNCKECGDSGYTAEGTACICLKNRVNSLISQEFGVPESTDYSFEDSLPHGIDGLECLVPFYDNLQKYCEAFPQTKFCSLMFFGAPGTGKTRLAACAANCIRQRGYSTLMLSAFKLNDIFLKCHLDFSGGGREYIAMLTSCDFLVIDDLGTENVLKNVTMEYLLSVLSDRLASNRHTLITTNLDSAQFRARYDDRLHSRIADKNKTFVFNFDGCDIRQLSTNF